MANDNVKDIQKDIVIHFDGGCTGPGGIASYGYIIEFPGAEPIEGMGVSLADDPDATNNYAEYSAVLFALRHLKGHDVNDTDVLKKPVLLLGDSKMVVNMIRKDWGWKKLKWNPHPDHPHLREILMRIHKELRSFENWRIEWIPREENYKADKLNRIARKKFKKGEIEQDQLEEYKDGLFDL